ncbi:cytochrome-c oxidase, cbb3-type subunit III [Ponticoccus sp. SC2-23]|uniref:cytochrome-c oxidase, cbb3-type subunit III n=1 Tax=Alexandriicola marinus TaxID=2081710 RepID=UPI000FD7BCA8|nr:cytochrome-c oxidase, cbb3-type subunit III [Alexandriicola marinus]MBM1219870.1 cytochrome-c oxidase, cbb3-type subunit III [Ponticoccus sp. SC6-9]MBM1224556.1 cytochrome-c oxidase, cbb3-type subunit III [Ponticoccus sp. SC6-15]MBM1228069.1 cytochrome-c oxidase, cbb3-type subunit III [Ponticoccus sp. SC6-38]MBM1234293.1 cytochrome-c oxidase, cbb3-type subunit III [Ponticoccus sp. SC6-45]MBM1238571.1 cytochrome-c oxidase, cbb3-type subunit III [Ponticoccus sp. SC6-49]MBM1242352.1 cytochrom
MSDAPKVDKETGVETTGHSWDGIEELNSPLPRWWLWTFYLTIIWAIGYTIAYPAWPMVRGATEGVLGWSTRANVAADIEEHEALNADLANALVAADLTTLETGSDLLRYATSRGQAVFIANCSQCHGSGAAGVQAAGYPNLLDDAWLWGGEIDQIAYTVRHGIRNETDPDARWSEMPAFADIFSREETEAVVEYVYSLTSDDHDAALAETGSTLFLDNCAACHGDNAMGNPDLGAPNLSDAIWLYGGDRDTLTETVMNSRFGVMPAWGLRISEADVRAVSAYVHSLGGGE